MKHTTVKVTDILFATCSFLTLSVLPVYADGCTPLFFASAVHLVLGNAVIGVAEALICIRFFNTSVRRTLACIIAANYVSAWVGVLLLKTLRIAVSNYGHHAYGIQEAAAAMNVAIVVSFFFTLAVEWPFFLAAFNKSEQRVKQSIMACFICQFVSYGCLIGWYGLMNPTNDRDDTGKQLPIARLSDQVDLTPAKVASIYFIGENGRNIYKLTPPATTPEKVADGEFQGQMLELYQPQGGVADIYATPSGERKWMHYAPSSRSRTIVSGISMNTPHIYRGSLQGEPAVYLDGREDHLHEYHARGSSPQGPGMVYLDGREPWKTEPYHSFRKDLEEAGYWWVFINYPITQKGVDFEKGNNRFRLAQQSTLLSSQNYSYLTVLPGDRAIIQVSSDGFTKNQILVIDLNSRKYGVLADGQSPLIVLKE